MLHCHACGELQPVDAHWRAIHMDCDSGIRISRALPAEQIPCQHPEAVFACGQGSALVLVERWLHTGTFEPAQAHLLQPQPAAHEGETRA